MCRGGGATCCRNSGAIRTWCPATTPNNLRLYKNQKSSRQEQNWGGGTRKTRCSHSGIARYSCLRRQLARERDRRRVGAHSARRAAAADGHLRALRASTHSHTARGAVVCACEVVVVCRRFYYEPIITPPPPVLRLRAK